MNDNQKGPISARRKRVNSAIATTDIFLGAVELYDIVGQYAAFGGHVTRCFRVPYDHKDRICTTDWWEGSGEAKLFYLSPVEEEKMELRFARLSEWNDMLSLKSESSGRTIARSNAVVIIDAELWVSRGDLPIERICINREVDLAPLHIPLEFYATVRKMLHVPTTNSVWLWVNRKFCLTVTAVSLEGISTRHITSEAGVVDKQLEVRTTQVERIEDDFHLIAPDSVLYDSIHGGIWTLTIPSEADIASFRHAWRHNPGPPPEDKAPKIRVARYDAKTCVRSDTGEIGPTLALELFGFAFSSWRRKQTRPWCSMFVWDGELWICIGRELSIVRMLVFDGKSCTLVRSFDTNAFANPDKLTDAKPWTTIPEFDYDRTSENRIRFLACPLYGIVLAFDEGNSAGNTCFILQ